jgi:hypothetical protein
MCDQGNRVYRSINSLFLFVRPALLSCLGEGIFPKICHQ